MVPSHVIFILTSLLTLQYVFIASSEEILPSIPLPSNHLQVYALPVGQGDCTIIQCPNGNIVVFDCGSSGPRGGREEAPTIQNWLGNYINQVVAILVSHADSDHYNYLTQINWNAQNTNYVIVGNRESYNGKGETINEWLNGWNNLGKLHTIGTGGQFPNRCIGDCQVSGGISTNFCGDQSGINFFILAANVRQESNQQSIVMKIVVGQWSMLLSGDMEGAASIEIAKELGKVLESTVYKMSHHGASLHANWLEWLNPIKPQSAFISSAYAKNYLHPRCLAISRLLMVGTITCTAPHLFYCGNGDRTVYIYNERGFLYNIWETSPVENLICLLMYTATATQLAPDDLCYPPPPPAPEESQLMITDDGDDDDDDVDDDDDDDKDNVGKCDLPDGVDGEAFYKGADAL